jgi:hypothetical protein
LPPGQAELWHRACLFHCRQNVTQWEGAAMALILSFARRWNKWYRVLRYRKGFGLLDSVRYGLWLARS